MIRSIEDLKEAYGSYSAAAFALGMSRQALHNSRMRGHLPLWLYFKQQAVLEAHGHKADQRLWNFAKVGRRRAAAE